VKPCGPYRRLLKKPMSGLFKNVRMQGSRNPEP
jgi:hypothetical protein